MKTIRIANGQGFWGDWLEAPVQLVERGPIDYLTLDYLAEITMSIMQKQRSRDARTGYATDFVTTVERVLPACVDGNVKIVANAGGVNPEARDRPRVFGPPGEGRRPTAGAPGQGGAAYERRARRF